MCQLKDIECLLVSLKTVNKKGKENTYGSDLSRLIVVSVHYKHDRYIVITQTCHCNILQYFTAIKMIIFR